MGGTYSEEASNGRLRMIRSYTADKHSTITAIICGERSLANDGVV